MTTTYDDLRQRMIDGDTSITATALDKARRDADFEQLQDEATAAAEQRAAEAERQEQIRGLNVEAGRLAGAGFDEMQQHYATALGALRSLRHAMAGYNAQVFKVQHTAERLDTGLDIEVPGQFNIEFELDRLERLARTDTEPSPPYSRLHVPVEG